MWATAPGQSLLAGAPRIDTNAVGNRLAASGEQLIPNAARTVASLEANWRRPNGSTR